MDRLLSEQEKRQLFDTTYGADENNLDVIYLFIQAIAAAQLAKADKEWIAWCNKFITAPPCFGEHDEPCSELNCEDYPCTMVAWQERKREVGQ